VKPNAENFNPDPQSIKDLINSTRMTRPKLAKRIGCEVRTLERWMAGDRTFNYRDQFSLECLVLAV